MFVTFEKKHPSEAHKLQNHSPARPFVSCPNFRRSAKLVTWRNPSRNAHDHAVERWAAATVLSLRRTTAALVRSIQDQPMMIGLSLSYTWFIRFEIFMQLSPALKSPQPTQQEVGR
ncbi:hypothetical protein ACJJTC_002618 [Scirpophaga incertulas]